MARLPYFHFYPDNWLADTAGLTLEEKGAYFQLLAWSWNRGPIPADPARRALILGTSEEDENRLWRVLSTFWTLGDDGFTNARLERERAKARQRSEAGSRGGSETQAKRQANRQASRSQKPEARTSSGDEGGEVEDRRPTPEQAPLSHLLASLMVENGCRRPRITEKWATEERLLVERDSVDPGEAERVLRWCQDDEFWKTNILSMPKFRKQYDALRLKALGAPQPPDDGFENVVPIGAGASIDDGFGDAA